MGYRTYLLARRATRSGYRRLVDGARRGERGRTWLGLAMMVGGLTVRLASGRKRTLIYRTEMTVGEAVGIRVVEGGEVVTHTIEMGEPA